MYKTHSLAFLPTSPGIAAGLRWVWRIAITACLLLTVPTGSVARQGEPPRSQQATQPLAAVAQVVLPAVDAQARLAEDAKDQSPGPLRYAVPIAVMMTPDTDGTWEELPNAGRLWRLRLHVPGATDLNFGFTSYWLPEGATLHILSEVELYYQGPYTAQDNKALGQLWTPAVPGDRAVIELYLPPGDNAAPVVTLTHVGAGYRDLFKRGPQDKQGFCNNDVVCPEGDPWRDQIRSVGLISIVGVGTCTGSLIMDAESSFRPFFLTANHCQ